MRRVLIAHSCTGCRRARRAEPSYLDRRDDPVALAAEKRRQKSITRVQRSRRR